jgi:hypothetical protein
MKIPPFLAGEQAERWTRLPDGKGLNGLSLCCTRSALPPVCCIDVINRQVTVVHYFRRRSDQFLEVKELDRGGPSGSQDLRHVQA